MVHEAEQLMRSIQKCLPNNLNTCLDASSKETMTLGSIGNGGTIVRCGTCAKGMQFYCPLTLMHIHICHTWVLEKQSQKLVLWYSQSVTFASNVSRCFENKNNSNCCETKMPFHYLKKW